MFDVLRTLRSNSHRSGHLPSIDWIRSYRTMVVVQFSVLYKFTEYILVVGLFLLGMSAVHLVVKLK